MRRAFGLFALAALLAAVAAGQVADRINPTQMGSSGPKNDEALPPVAAFSCTPIRADDPPLLVTCTDASTGSPTSWAWDFGDSGTSTLQNPTHTFVTDETQYTVTLVATNAGGSDSEIKVDYIDVSTPPALPEPLFYLNMSSSTPTHIKSPATLSTFDSYYNNETFGVPGKVGTAVTAPGIIGTSSTAYPEALTWVLSNGREVNRERTCNVWIKTHDGVDGRVWEAYVAQWSNSGGANAFVGYPQNPWRSENSFLVASDTQRSNLTTHASLDGVVSLATWHMFTWSVRANGVNNTMDVYKDSVLATRVDFEDNPDLDRDSLAATYRVNLGGTQVIDEFACWNERLTQGHIDIIYNGGAGIALPYP